MSCCGAPPPSTKVIVFGSATARFIPVDGMSAPSGADAARAWVGMPSWPRASATVVAVVVMVCGLPSTTRLTWREWFTTRRSPSRIGASGEGDIWSVGPTAMSPEESAPPTVPEKVWTTWSTPSTEIVTSLSSATAVLPPAATAMRAAATPPLTASE